MILRGLLCWLLALFAPSAGAIELRLAGTEATVLLEPYAFTFEDKSAAMDIGDVLHEASFVPDPDLLHAGFSRSAIWLKFDLANKSALPMTRWLEVQGGEHLREVTLFLQYNGDWRRMDAGSGLPFARRPIVAMNPVFPIGLEAGQTRTLYLRIASSMPITVTPALWDPLAFRTHESRTRLADGLMLGGLATMALIGILLYSMFRDRAFLLNALATLTYFLGELAAKGYSFMYLWPEGSNWVMRCVPMYALLGVGLNLMFLRDLLETPRRFPRINILLLLLLASEWIVAPGILFGQAEFWAHFSFHLHFPITGVMALVGIYAAIRGVHAARYYTLAYGILAIGSLLHALWLTGVSAPSVLGGYALPLGMLLNNVFLLASVVDRIMAERREKDTAQNALLAERAAHAAELENAVEQRTVDLNDALRKTRKAGQERSLLLAYIGHDLRAPIATIMNYIQRLGQHSDPEVRRYQTTIERTALHQLELIEDLVEFARGELDHLELVPEPTYLYDWIDNIAAQAEILSAEYNNRFILDIAVSMPPIVVFDAKRLRQVLINLLANAAKFTTDGEVRLRLHATPRDQGKVEMHFAVEDTGAGIPTEDAQRMFQPFERRKSTRAGIGLGLSIARQLVSAMGGQLAMESELSVGSRFSFGLVMETASEADVMSPAQAFVFPEPFGAGKTLLVADDNLASREYLREVLSTADFDVICVENGTEALRVALGRDVDAVLIDQFMPGMDGWEVLRELHDRRPGAVPPFVLYSASPPRPPGGYPDSLRFDETLLKPVATDKLLRVIMELLSRSSANPQMALPSAEWLSSLRQLVADGRISDIEDWSTALASRHPELGGFARRISEAAIRIDLGELERMLASALSD